MHPRVFASFGCRRVFRGYAQRGTLPRRFKSRALIRMQIYPGWYFIVGDAILSLGRDALLACTPLMRRTRNLGLKVDYIILIIKACGFSIDRKR